MRDADRGTFISSESKENQLPEGGAKVTSSPRLLFSTVLELLQYRASPQSETQNKQAFTFLHDGARRKESLTFLELEQHAKIIAAHIQSHAAPGDRILLVLPPGLDYIAAFVGCIYAGVVAVPAPPPSNAKTLPRLQLLTKDAAPRLAVTSVKIASKLTALRSGDNRLNPLDCIAVDNLGEPRNAWTQPDCRPDDILFLQYTSGSTGAPKGVMVSHNNLLANLELSRKVYDTTSGDIFVSWLPPHHDFGLIGAILTPIYLGCHSIHFSPAAFLTRPYRWLKAITDYRGTITGAPNFAYELCVAKVTSDEKKTLNLNRLRVAVNAAERIRYDTLSRFVEAFRECGFIPEALTPAYGLAEATLFVSANTARRSGNLPRSLAISKTLMSQGEVALAGKNEDAVVLLSTGAASRDGQDVAIVAPETSNAKAADFIGEIWVSGPSVASGYWRRPQETFENFSRRVDGRPGAYLRTGDLGFIHDNELYISGRIKEMMIFGGRNIYPQDIEATVERLNQAFRPHGCAAFSSEEGANTDLIIVQELYTGVKLTAETLVADIHAALFEEHELLDLSAFVLVKAGAIPRTTSGKIQRGRTRELFLSDGLAPLWQWRRAHDKAPIIRPYEEPSSVTEKILAEIWIALLGVEKVSVHDNFFERGGHSLLAMQMMRQLRDACGVELPLQTLFLARSLGELASEVDTAAASTTKTSSTDIDSIVGRVTAQVNSMTPDQVRSLLAEKRARNRR